MNILLLKGYNNYFNRILKREDTIANYKNAVVSGNLWRHNHKLTEWHTLCDFIRELPYSELITMEFNDNEETND